MKSEQGEYYSFYHDEATWIRINKRIEKYYNNLFPIHFKYKHKKNQILNEYGNMYHKGNHNSYSG